MNSIFTWFKGQNRSRYSSGYIGPFAVMKKKNDSWVLLMDTQEGLFEVPIQKVENAVHQP